MHQFNKGWLPSDKQAIFHPSDLSKTISKIREPLAILKHNDQIGVGLGGSLVDPTTETFDLFGICPPLFPEWLGDRSFTEDHNVRFAYVGGAMARGICSVEMVLALSKAGMLCFFGSAGLPVPKVKEALKILNQELEVNEMPWGINLIHTPGNVELEQQLIDLYLANNVKRVSASAFMGLTLPLVHYASKGLRKNKSGKIIRKNFLFPKISRPEVAKHFFMPPPIEMLNTLVQTGRITQAEADISKTIPLASDMTVESDSGGHTDGRPMAPLFSRIIYMRNQLLKSYKSPLTVRLGIGGGIGTPESVSSAFSLGAAYVIVGSVHQSCLESGTSSPVKQLLTTADISDSITCPSADMFEIGGKVQVMKKGTMMGVRGVKLWDLYNRYNSIEEIPNKEKESLEKTVFKMSLEDVWSMTEKYLEEFNPWELEKASIDSKYKMAMIFRWYLGKSSKWALEGEDGRLMDYQIWSGPSMGAFNYWVKGSFLEKAENREVKQVALNLMEGAAVITRARQLRTYGLDIPDELVSFSPVKMR